MQQHYEHYKAAGKAVANCNTKYQNLKAQYRQASLQNKPSLLVSAKEAAKELCNAALYCSEKRHDFLVQWKHTYGGLEGALAHIAEMETTNKIVIKTLEWLESEMDRVVQTELRAFNNYIPPGRPAA
ncbi:hypothetical protein M011DRAFT_491108 [Sporormia fimetaria CBS 119925]|uniref:Uncharacterized protein n=1 Tax=Sporormia fimetaria CBS 119925 TaxID=1340428 RepID=A0A6A6UWC7_9PLEO|nr:hypothetical protein M011DRAFT_491108 [Sporormia fimetaria CBS 119925]